jgi:hypothetical protein
VEWRWLQLISVLLSLGFQECSRTNAIETYYDIMIIIILWIWKKKGHRVSETKNMIIKDLAHQQQQILARWDVSTPQERPNIYGS